MTNAADQRTVLIVEDETLLRRIASDEFEDAGYAVIEAEDGPSAVRLLESGGRIDLLFPDIRLRGGRDGGMIAERARALRPALPIIYATGFVPDELRTLPRSLFFKKPYRPSEIIAAAARLGG